jgi:antitoxin component YwqK of YwqJK toxin-antitoxin module
MTYLGGRLEGELRRCYPGGAVMQRAYYRQGRLIGAVEDYTPAGKRHQPAPPTVPK